MEFDELRDRILMLFHHYESRKEYPQAYGVLSMLPEASKFSSAETPLREVLMPLVRYGESSHRPFIDLTYDQILLSRSEAISRFYRKKVSPHEELILKIINPDH